VRLALVIFGVVATLIPVARLARWGDTSVGAVVALEQRGWHLMVGLCIAVMWPSLLVGVPVRRVAMIGRRRRRLGVVDFWSYRTGAGG
jgi:hypothetical protein